MLIIVVDIMDNKKFLEFILVIYEIPYEEGDKKFRRMLFSVFNLRVGMVKW